MAGEADDKKLRAALDALEGVSGSVSAWKTQDPAVRAAYNLLVKTLSKHIWSQYKAGKISAEEGATAANKGRNFIMQASRLASTPEGRAAAKKLKPTGFSLEAVTDYYANKFFKKPFTELAAAEKTKVFEEVIQSAGRTRAGVNDSMKALGASARLFWVLTLLMAAYDIGTARDKVTATVHLVAVLGASILVGEIFGGLLGSAVGPWGTAGGAILGGLLGAWMVDHYAYHDADPALTGH